MSPGISRRPMITGSSSTSSFGLKESATLITFSEAIKPLTINFFGSIEGNLRIKYLAEQTSAGFFRSHGILPHGSSPFTRHNRDLKSLSLYGHDNHQPRSEEPRNAVHFGRNFALAKSIERTNTGFCPWQLPMQSANTTTHLHGSIGPSGVTTYTTVCSSTETNCRRKPRSISSTIALV